MALAASRIFLNATKLGAVVWAGLIAVTIFGLGILYAARPKMNKNVIAGLVLAVGVAVIAGGIVTAVDGQRDFEHHGDDHGEEHGEDHSEEGEASE
jgi:membrane protein DedA with SNARE-associated domain